MDGWKAVNCRYPFGVVSWRGFGGEPRQGNTSRAQREPPLLRESGMPLKPPCWRSSPAGSRPDQAVWSSDRFSCRSCKWNCQHAARTYTRTYSGQGFGGQQVSDDGDESGVMKFSQRRFVPAVGARDISLGEAWWVVPVHLLELSRQATRFPISEAECLYEIHGDYTISYTASPEQSNKT